MKNTKEFNIDSDTIRKVGLRISDKQINAHIAPGSRIFEYPHLENVFVMESDLYGNAMPKNSCFLAFNGKHGLVGKHMTTEALMDADVADIKSIVESNTEG